jgi:hypothetical protein
MLVVDGKLEVVKGLTGTDYMSNPKVAFTKKRDFGLRKGGKVKNIAIHTRMGINPQKFEKCTKDRNWDFNGVRNASADDRVASWHISIDSDGSYACHMDLVRHKAYHCGQCNEVSVGIEMYQGADGTITFETLDACVKIVDTLCFLFKIEKKFPDGGTILEEFASGKKTGNAKRDRAYLPNGKSATEFSGVFGHRNATRNRGKGDPGDEIFNRLEAAGYKRVVVE